MKILVADDDHRIHLIIRMWLGRNGHDITSAANGKEALALLRQEHFDGLITDMNMPFLKGKDVLHQILNTPSQPDLIVVLTSRCDLAQLAAEINCPDVHFINKPFSPAVLAARIEELQSRLADRSAAADKNK